MKEEQPATSQGRSDYYVPVGPNRNKCVVVYGPDRSCGPDCGLFR